MQTFLFLFLLLCYLVGTRLNAQAPPQAINYQASARDASGNLITGPVGVRISIHSGSATGPLIYQETHNAVANAYGLFNISIGQGIPSGGNAVTFGNIDWSSNIFFLKTEINVGAGFTTMGTQQILSVPYALYAARAATADNAGSTITLTGGPGIAVSGGPSNFTISANLAMNDLTDVNTAGVGVGQVLKWDGSQWTPANDVGGGAGDNWGTQVAQTNATLTGNGTSASPLGIAQQGATNGQTLKWNGTSWAPANDNDAQTLTLAGNNLSISGGNSVTLPSGGDNWGSQVVQTNTTLSGNGTSTNPLGLAQQGAANGQVLKWNGSSWAPSTDNDSQTLSLSGNTLSISGGNSITLPSGGGLSGSGTVDYVARFTPNATTLGIGLIRDNGTGVGINTAPSTSEVLSLSTSSNASGIRVYNQNVTGGSYAIRGGFDGAAYQNAGFLGYNGNIMVGTQTVPNAAVYAQANTGASGALVAATSGTNTSAANIALSTVWHGVIGWSNYNAGASLASGVGVLGQTTGASDLNMGVYGNYNGTAAGAAAIFGYNNYSNVGANNIGVEGSYNPAGFGIGVAGIGFNGGYPVASLDIGVYGSVGNNSNYSIYGSGNFAVVNGTKSASVGTSKGNQLLYCVESPGVWFEDFGVAQLVNGTASVQLDPLFLETVAIDEQHPMIVTVTPQGNCAGLYVEPGTTGFTVRELQGGQSNVPFVWRVSCKRLHYQDHRFGADLAQRDGDTRSDYSYVSPRPIDYKEALSQMQKDKITGPIRLTPRNRMAMSMTRLQQPPAGN